MKKNRTDQKCDVDKHRNYLAPVLRDCWIWNTDSSQFQFFQMAELTAKK